MSKVRTEEEVIIQKQRMKAYRKKIKDMDSLINLLDIQKDNESKGIKDDKLDLEIEYIIDKYKKEYDWFENVYTNWDLRLFKESNYNIRKLSKLKDGEMLKITKEELKTAVIKLDEIFKSSIERLKNYLLQNYIKSYPVKFTHNEIVEILTIACKELNIYEFNSGSYLTLMFDVKYNEGVYIVTGDFTGGGYKIKGRIGKAKFKIN